MSFNNIVPFQSLTRQLDWLANNLDALSPQDKELVERALETEQTTESEALQWDLAFNAADGETRAAMEQELEDLKNLLDD